MRKSSTRRRKSKSATFFPIVFLVLLLLAVSFYVVSHFNEASVKGKQISENRSAQKHAAVTQTPAVLTDTESAAESTPSETPAVSLVVSTLAEATLAEATLAEATPVELIAESTPAEEEKKLLQVYFMSVGRNDGILIRMGDECAFIDGGREVSAAPAAKYISEELGIKKLKYYIATHGHDDHVGCAGMILSTFETETILYNNDLSLRTMKDSAATHERRELIDQTEKQLFLLNDTVMIGDAVLTCVGPENIVLRKNKDDGLENENSMIIRLTYGNRSFLLTGDATSKNFSELLEFHPEAAVCDVIKGAHHENPINKEFLNATNAKYYVYSTGDNFPPKGWDVNKVRETGARVFVTSNSNAGSTLFTTDGDFLDVATENTAPQWKLDINKLKIRAGKSIRCTFTLGKNVIDTLYWTSSDESIARVEYDFGRVKIFALKPGKCTITATHFDGSTREIAVEVKK